MNSKSNKKEFLNKKRKPSSEDEDNSEKSLSEELDLNENKKQTDKNQSKSSSNKNSKNSEKYNDDILVGQDEVTLILNSKKRLSIRKYMGKVYVDIREFFEKDGKTLPTKKGVSLTPDLWEKIKKYQNEIDEAIANIK